MNSLSPDLIYEISFRLDPKSLLRFQAINKTLYQNKEVEIYLEIIHSGRNV